MLRELPGECSPRPMITYSHLFNGLANLCKARPWLYLQQFYCFACRFGARRGGVAIWVPFSILQHVETRNSGQRDFVSLWRTFS
jgi:hypothetical protein